MAIRLKSFLRAGTPACGCRTLECFTVASMSPTKRNAILVTTIDALAFSASGCARPARRDPCRGHSVGYDATRVARIGPVLLRLAALLVAVNTRGSSDPRLGKTGRGSFPHPLSPVPMPPFPLRVLPGG